MIEEEEIMEDEVIKNIRACLMASKGGLTFDNLSRDYEMLLDENIPFKKLGYPTLADFLNIVPGIKTREREGEYFIQAIPTSKSAHISKLVSQQKTTTKKPTRLVNTRKSVLNYQSVKTKMITASTKRVPTLTKKVPSPTKRVLSPTKKVSSMTQEVSPLTKNLSYMTKEIPSPTEKVSSTTKKVPCPIKNVIDTSRMIGSKYTVIATNLRPIKITFYLNNEKPRYIHPIPPTPPSKRLKERQTNAAVWSAQSYYKSKDDCYYKSDEKIYQKPKTVSNNVETCYKPYYRYKGYRDHSPRSSYRSMEEVRKKSYRDRSPRTYSSDKYHYH
nr:tudor domain-containing protein 7-like isoform X1 [Megalopta genalis]XP_033339587.1 tudor domain-containing protein 7-like isoform X1 [Megalopta genalis]